MFQKIILIIFLILHISACQSQLAKPLPNGHAHNDYEKPWPALTKALEQGFVSVEIDIFPYKGILKVAHVGFMLGLAPNLEELYFKRLELWLEQHQQLFDNPNQRLIFMLDIKQNASETYALLKPLCQKYQHLITRYYPLQDSIVYGKIDLLLSGAKPYEDVLKDSIQYMFIDGGLGELNHPIRNNKIAPRISMNYHSQFKWLGSGKMPEKELQHLRNLVQKAHADNRTLRFWAMPNNINVWKTFLDEGVDWMNVDDLERFKEFYWEYQLNDN